MATPTDDEQQRQEALKQKAKQAEPSYFKFQAWYSTYGLPLATLNLGLFVYYFSFLYEALLVIVPLVLIGIFWLTFTTGKKKLKLDIYLQLVFCLVSFTVGFYLPIFI